MQTTFIIFFCMAFIYLSIADVLPTELDFANLAPAPTSAFMPSMVAEKDQANSFLYAPLYAESYIPEEETAMVDTEKLTEQLGFSNSSKRIVSFDFDDDEPLWYSVNDDVMGGISTSLVSTDPEVERLTFSGDLSLENNGGFASIRSQYTTYDLSEYDGIGLRVRGDGNVYRFRIRAEETGPQIAYTAWFKTKAGSWQEIYIPFSKMIPLYRGLAVKGAGPLDPASIRSFGLMLADKQQGEFVLEVDWISALSIRMNEIKHAELESEMERGLG